MATIHLGEKDYYQNINERIEGSIVLYELMGCDYAEKQEREKKIRNLEPSYQRLFKNIRRLQQRAELVAFHFGLSTQNDEFDLSSAKHLIHADVPASEVMQERYKRPEDLMRFLNQIRNEIGGILS